MKKLSLAVMAVVIAALCAGASIWEGSAAVSIGGELPEGGYYAATKSFPRNTVVDITNLETGKSVRVIVAAGLDSPGLLAILSKEAAELIGIQARSIGRIRMTMPADPVAFSRFTGGLNAGGDPDYDPRAAIAAASSRQEAGQPIIPPGPSAPAETPVWEASSLPSPQAEPAPPPPALQSGSPVIPADTPVPPENIRWPWEIPSLSFQTDRTGEQNPEPGQPAEGSLPAGGPEETPAAPSPEAAYRPPAGDPPGETPAAPSPETAYRPPAAVRPDNAIAYERGPELSGQPAPEYTARSTLILEPADPRPPESSGGLPPDAEIAPIPSSSPEAGPAGDDVEIPDQYVIPGIAARPPETKPEEPAPPQTAETAAGDEPVSSGFEEPPVRASDPRFSAPLISTLEKGMYYLQVRAFSKTELVQAELSRLGDVYPLAVQMGGASEKPLYRVLVGPVNLGESSALLRRFRGNGYGDAFIRQSE